LQWISVSSSDILRRIGKFILFLFLPLFFSGCLGTRYLDKGEKLLVKQKIKGNEKVSKEKLKRLFQQEPNRRLPLIPFSIYVWFYQVGLNTYDTLEIIAEKEAIERKYDLKIAKKKNNEKKVKKLLVKKSRKLAKKDKVLKEGNLLMRWGEPLATYDPELTAQTEDQMELFLNSKGFFNAEVEYKLRETKKKVKVIYKIEEGIPYRIDTIFRSIADTAISSLLANNQRKSEIKKGGIYEQTNLDAERNRIDDLLKNNGYYNFSRQYVIINVDTTWGEKEVALELVIQNPPNRIEHQVFEIDSVNFVTDAHIKNLDDTREHKNYGGIDFSFYEEKYSKKILNNKVLLHPGDIYSKEKTFDTQRQLSSLDVFKFINVTYQEDTARGKLIAEIKTSPLKKFQTTNEVGLNVSQGFPGPFFNSSFKKRNVFGGLEILELTAGVRIDGVSAATEKDEVFQSQQADGTISLTFPQILFPLPASLRSFVSKSQPRTVISSGVSFSNRPEYIRTIINSKISYNIKTRKNTQYNLTLGDLNLINSDTEDAFQNLLDSLNALGNNLGDAFEPSYVSSMSLTATYNLNQYGKKDISNSFLKLFFESGGTILNIFGKEIFQPGRLDLQTFQYLKFNADFRKNEILSSSNVLAYRVNLGVAFPYGDNKILPYEKFFFAGGSSSLRAWEPRRLGPGSFTPLNTSGVFDNSIEQPGEVQLEMSVELRKDLFGFVEGAVFFDAGNIWTISEEVNRPGAKLEFNDFIQEIALGSGLGIRLDFSFLILRLDAGVKIYDPARFEDAKFIWQKAFNEPPFNTTETVVFNIGVGYPF